jgi:hypothetical protein
MDSRSKFLAALDHAEGPVPIDLGSTAVTGLHATAVAALREHYGLEKRPVRIIEPYQMLGEVEEDLKAALGVDVQGVWPHETMFGFRNEGWKPWRTPWGQEVLVSRHFRTVADGDDVLIYPRGDTSAPPSGRLPGSGFFFDTIIRQPPLDETRLRVEDNLEEFGPVGADALQAFSRDLEAARGSGRGVIANFGGTGLGDIAIVPGPMLTHPRGIRDVAEWYVSTVARRDHVRAIFQRQTEIAIANLERINDAVAVRTGPDTAFICGTDFGTQTSMFCSPATFDALWAPFYARINAWIHEHTAWKTFKHSCGAVEPLIESFIACGFDILNPVQVSARGMDPATLKQRYGDRIVFWGGGVDTQKTLPFGTPAEVREEVLRRCEIFGRGGGFVFDAIHNIQARTPIANIVAMVDAVAEFNGD